MKKHAYIVVDTLGVHDALSYLCEDRPWRGGHRVGILTFFFPPPKKNANSPTWDKIFGQNRHPGASEGGKTSFKPCCTQD